MKKRSMGLFFLSCMLIFTNCGQKEEKKALEIINKEFQNQKVSLLWCEKDFLGNLSKDIEGNITITLTSENLTVPVTFLVTNEKITMSMPDLEMVGERRICPALMIYDCFKALSTGQVKSNGVTAEITYESFKAKIDLESERIISLEFPKGSLKFTT